MRTRHQHTLSATLIILILCSASYAGANSSITSTAISRREAATADLAQSVSRYSGAPKD